MGLLQDTLIQAITDSADDLRDTAQKLMATAEHYDSTDANNADGITRSGRLP
ncbi:hypothetical protein Adu01nite_69110 [Paractinoplanes durhamensis]|uniref:Uncharacterized protein n=1 Tax=Paractinoplanes durhamensis TaxID=113563 RepID=A0ABQ3Z6V7_9ACTN|nr:hypothetical protein Adu01nite_69110 [Actinoplanes durhamensis]